MESKRKKNLSKSLMLSACMAAMLSLAACQTTSGHETTQGKIDTALERAADQAQTQGDTTESLALLERLYQRDSANPATALKYAQALHDAGRLNRAAVTLSPFTQDVKKENLALLLEHASIMAEMGNYVSAEEGAGNALTLDSKSAKAYQILGIAQDAQGRNKQAEQAFRSALEYWEGDPTPILNNLGLNLASQGFIDEALDTLRRAAALSPNRKEIERNIRIVSALQVMPPKTGTRLAPMPPRRKPEMPPA